MSEVEEVAKAAAEVSKFGTTAVKTTERILGFVARVFKEPIEDAAGIVGDRLKLMRWKRQVRIVDEVDAILTKRGVVVTRAVAPKFAIPILESASLEEDDELQNIWIQLLANTMDPGVHTEFRYAFIEIIKSLTTLDVKILKFFYDSLSKDHEVDWNSITKYLLTKEQICEALNIDEQDYMVSTYNLFRVQCVAPAILKGEGVTLGSEPLTIFKGADAITMTPLGKNFVEACINK